MTEKGKRASLPQRLRLAREQAGLSQGQVAQILKLHRPSVSEMEAGRRKVSADELTKLSHIYDISVSWLLDESSEINESAVQLAARELAKLKREDLDTVMKLLRALRASGDQV